MGESNAYHFSLAEETNYSALSTEETYILDYVIEKLGKMSRIEIENLMHKEEAFTRTKQSDVILFKYAESLLI